MEQATSERKISPNLLLLLQSDSTAMTIALVPLILLVLYLSTFILNLTEEDFTSLLGRFVIALVFATTIILWRYYVIKRKLSKGIEIHANLVSKTLSRRSAELKISYSLEGKSLLRTTKLFNSSKVDKLKPGDPLTLVFDGVNLERYLIRELYV